MLYSKSIRLVNFLRLTVLCVCIIGVSGCSETKQENPEQTSVKSVAPAPAELSEARPLAGAEAEVKSLQYRVKPGDVFRYKFSQRDKLVQDGMNAETEQILYYTKTIKAVKSDGSVEMSVRYDSIRLSNDYPDAQDSTKRASSSYNSSNKADRENKEYSQYNGIIGEDVTMLVSKDGRISEISGLTPLLSKIFGEMKDSLNVQMQEQALEQIKVQLYLRPMQQEYQNYPDGGTIDSSKSWKRSERSPLSGVFLVDNDIAYRLDAVKNVGMRKAAYISAKLTSKIVNPLQKQGSITFKLNKSEISGSGETVLDVDKGYTILKKNTINTMIDAVLGDAKTKQSKRALQTLVSTMKVELIR
ncbi:hypothetical protein MASR2M18_16560 [Ignavibacteria bacterium]|nr:hypothetical protein [Bacteroidota bacterium]MCZ2133063.1 DUF6263 family protein [Bacteroidota bacterium]